MTTSPIIDQKAYDLRADKPVEPWRLNIPEAIANLTRGKEPEAFRTNVNCSLPVYVNGFIQTLQTCYSEHYTLVLAPDDVWTTIAQSFATHVDQNAETLRRQFVAHEGKVHIQWCNDSLVMGSPDNDWMKGFDFFSGEIKKHIGKKHDLLTANFSTTGIIEKAVSQVILMDAMKHYFSYGVTTACGIPEITLLGTTDDWKSIRTRVQNFVEFEGLAAWVNRLDPILTQFVKASEGDWDLNFWKDIYKRQSMGSGNPWVSGWANAFFLYLQDSEGWRKNPLAENEDQRFSPTDEMYPTGISKVPFTWAYYGNQYEYEFLGGFLGTSQDPETLALRPALGWAVRPK